MYWFIICSATEFTYWYDRKSLILFKYVTDKLFPIQKDDADLRTYAYSNTQRKLFVKLCIRKKQPRLGG